MDFGTKQDADSSDTSVRLLFRFSFVDAVSVVSVPILAVRLFATHCARYREFESLAHLNQLAEQWLKEEADPRLHGTVKKLVAERFAAGTGKTMLAVALGINAVEAGHRVLFLTLETLITRLRRAQTENRLEWQLQQWVAPKVLVVDELGYLPMSREKANLFFRLVALRCSFR